MTSKKPKAEWVEITHGVSLWRFDNGDRLQEHAAQRNQPLPINPHATTVIIKKAKP